MTDERGLAMLFGDSPNNDRLLVLALAAALIHERASLELILALLYIAM